MVQYPKTRKTFCGGADCRNHQTHKVVQYKVGKASPMAQGKRRYDMKQKGFGGQTKPVFHKKVCGCRVMPDLAGLLFRKLSALIFLAGQDDEENHPEAAVQ